MYQTKLILLQNITINLGLKQILLVNEIWNSCSNVVFNTGLIDPLMYCHIEQKVKKW